MEEMFMAELAYNIRRYEDCLEYLTPLMKNCCDLDMKTIKMWSKCHQRIINQKRSAWVMVLKLENNLNVNNVNRSVFNEHKLNISSDIERTCNEIIRFLGICVMGNVSNVRHKILIYQICGDCHRYKAEVSVGETMLANYNEALNQYKFGWELCSQNTVSVSILLYFAVKYAICLNSIHGSERAILLFEEALDMAHQRYDGENVHVNIIIDHIIKYKQSVSVKHDNKFIIVDS